MSGLTGLGLENLQLGSPLAGTANDSTLRALARRLPAPARRPARANGEQPFPRAEEGSAILATYQLNSETWRDILRMVEGSLTSFANGWVKPKYGARAPINSHLTKSPVCFGLTLETLR